MAASLGCWPNRPQRLTPDDWAKVWAISTSKRCAASTQRCGLCWISSQASQAMTSIGETKETPLRRARVRCGPGGWWLGPCGRPTGRGERCVDAGCAGGPAIAGFVCEQSRHTRRPTPEAVPWDRCWHQFPACLCTPGRGCSRDRTCWVCDHICHADAHQTWAIELPGRALTGCSR